MIFERHSELEGKHAILSPSQCSWLGYSDDEELFKRFKSFYAAKVGTVIHGLAQELIERKVRLNKVDKKLVYFELIKNDIPRSIISIDDWYDSLSLYINDAISFGMTPEVQLIFSEWAFGTADAISFTDNVLRIHDLKTGSVPAKMDQLICYAALFCLNQKVKPSQITTHLRIYQRNEVLTLDPDPIDISRCIDNYVAKNKILMKFAEG